MKRKYSGNYLDEWDLINSEFTDWFNGESWDKQKEYLSGRMKYRFKLSTANIKKIFATFDDIYPDHGFSFDWNDYQFPTLVGIAGKYVLS